MVTKIQLQCFHSFVFIKSFLSKKCRYCGISEADFDYMRTMEIQGVN